MRHRDSMFRRAAQGLAALAMMACSKSDTQRTSATAPPESESNATAAASAAASPSSATLGSGVTIEPAWVAADPKLTTLLSAAKPACLIKESFVSSGDGVAHAYEVYAPSVDQAELEKRFRNAARALGYSIQRRPVVGLGFDDEAKQRSGSISDARVSVLLAGVTGSTESARRLVTKHGFESWSLIEALDADWSSIAVERSAGNAGTFEAELKVAPAKLPTVEAWARQRKLERDGDSWVRKLRKDAPDVAAIVIDVDDGKLSLTEVRGGPLSGAACQQHASRPSAPSADAADPSAEGDLAKEFGGE
jgi:hypothetical protein